MHKPIRHLRFLTAALALALAPATVLTSCAFEPTQVSGKVIDVTTQQPIEGAYVLAEYKKGGGVLGGHSASWCVRTAGMTTGKDGAFQFPYKTESGATLSQAYAVKPGYYFERPGAEYSTGKKNLTPYANWEVWLVKQEQSPPKGLGAVLCTRPESREAVLANIEYLKIKYAEQVRIGQDKDLQEISLREINSLLERTSNSSLKK